MIYIYALQDPFTMEYRYIGKTVRPHERLLNQCNEHSNTYRCHWIQSVLRAGSRPIQVILQTLSDDADWQNAEKMWIAEARASGWPLVNGTDGGDGVVGLSPEAREKITKTWKGRKHRPESLEKMSIANRGRVHTEEYKEYMRELMQAREFTPQHRARLSKSNLKLTDEQVAEIREKLAQGVAQRAIAKEYGVHQGTISNISQGKYGHSYNRDVTFAGLTMVFSSTGYHVHALIPGSTRTICGRKFKSVLENASISCKLCLSTLKKEAV